MIFLGIQSQNGVFGLYEWYLGFKLYTHYSLGALIKRSLFNLNDYLLFGATSFIW